MIIQLYIANYRYQYYIMPSFIDPRSCPALGGASHGQRGECLQERPKKTKTKEITSLPQCVCVCVCVCFGGSNIDRYGNICFKYGKIRKIMENHVI